MEKLFFKNIEDLEKEMTEEQKRKAKENFDKYFPKGTPEIMCVSDEDGDQYLKLIDLSNFE